MKHPLLSYSLVSHLIINLQNVPSTRDWVTTLQLTAIGVTLFTDLVVTGHLDKVTGWDDTHFTYITRDLILDLSFQNPGSESSLQLCFLHSGPSHQLRHLTRCTASCLNSLLHPRPPEHEDGRMHTQGAPASAQNVQRFPSAARETMAFQPSPSPRPALPSPLTILLPLLRPHLPAPGVWH